MKTLLFFLLAISATHAAAQDAGMMETIESVVPPQYASYISLGLLLVAILGRAWHAIVTNGGLTGLWSALLKGTNTPPVSPSDKPTQKL